jgi:hypothetical protein
MSNERRRAETVPCWHAFADRREAFILQAAAGRSEYKTGILEEAFAKQLETLGFQRRVRLRESKTPVH